MYGDVDGNGSVNLTDLSVLSQFFAEIISSVEAGADVDGNGSINLTDLSVLSQYFAEIIDTLGPQA